MLKNAFILLPFFVPLFWAAYFFIEGKRNSRSQKIWMIATLFIATSMGIAAFYWQVDGNYSLFYKLDVLDAFMTLSFIPMIFLYFREVTGDKSRLDWKITLLFLPPVFLGVASTIVYAIMGDEQSAAYAKAMIENEDGILYDSSMPFYRLRVVVNEYIYSISLFLQAIIVLVYVMYRLIIYRKHLNDFFSNIDDKSMSHHWAVFWGLVALLGLTSVVAASGYLLYIEYDAWVSFIEILAGTILYYICFHVSQSRYTAANFDHELKLSDNEAIQQGYGLTLDKELLSEDSDDHSNIHAKLLPEFNRAIDEEKIFLHKNLRIDDVARLVSTNRTYISRLLKDEYHSSFWEFINRKRIDYAKEQICQQPNLTQEELAEMSGFTHDTSFSRAFKQCEGITFREWRKKHSV